MRGIHLFLSLVKNQKFMKENNEAGLFLKAQHPFGYSLKNKKRPTYHCFSSKGSVYIIRSLYVSYFKEPKKDSTELQAKSQGQKNTLLIRYEPEK